MHPCHFQLSYDTEQSGTNNNMDILNTFRKGFTMSALEAFEIYKAFKQKPNNILKEHLSFSSNILYDNVSRCKERNSQSSLDND